MTDDHRLKIQNGNILNALVEHVQGKREMSASQVTAGIALLRKIMPDLAAVEHSGEMKVQHDITDVPVSDEQWEREHAGPTVN